MNKVNCKVIQATSKKGTNYECLEFSVDCGGGVVYTTRAFVSPLELRVIKQALSPINDIYSDTSLQG